MRFPNKHTGKQKGQAIPIGIAAILGVTILMLTLFNTSQVVSEKMRIVNTADAAAYSGMVVQARTMNFTAYTNRAMVANQVALAQMTTLYSFGPYLQRLGVNLSYALRWIPYAGVAIAAVVQNATRIANRAIQLFVQLNTPIINGMQVGITLAQRTTNLASVLATRQIVVEVVRANDPAYEVTTAGYAGLGLNIRDWTAVSKRYDNNLYQTRKSELALNSRDGFSTSRRGWGRANIADIWFAYAYFQRDADTRLISQGSNNSRTQSNLKWEWKAKDTFSLWAGVRYWDWGWKSSEGEVPIGYASAYMSTNNRDFGANTSGCWWGWFCNSGWGFKNRTAETLADTQSNKFRLSAGYGGMQPYYDLADTSSGSNVVQKRSPTTALGIEVRRKVNSPIRTSSNINNLGSTQAYVSGSTRNGLGATGLYRVDDQFAGNNYGVSAVARAELYFSRPIGVGTRFRFNQRADGKIEYANLFNPYWDVRLVDASFERNAALVARGLSSVF